MYLTEPAFHTKCRNLLLSTKGNWYLLSQQINISYPSKMVSYKCLMKDLNKNFNVHLKKNICCYKNCGVFNHYIDIYFRVNLQLEAVSFHIFNFFGMGEGSVVPCPHINKKGLWWLKQFDVISYLHLNHITMLRLKNQNWTGYTICY